MSTLQVDSIVDAAGTGAPDFTNGVKVSGGAALTGLVSGSYTAVLTETSSILSSETLVGSNYIRVGSFVMVAVVFTATPANSGEVTLRISLPVASTFSNTEECLGTATVTASSTSGDGGYITADTSNNEAKLTISSESAGGARTYAATFIYEVI